MDMGKGEHKHALQVLETSDKSYSGRVAKTAVLAALMFLSCCTNKDKVSIQGC